jgi:hypothetical protein
MKTFLRLSFLLLFVSTVAAVNAQPVYCTPPVTTGGIYFSLVGFGAPYGNVPGGVNYDSGGSFASEGYANRSGSSSGTVNRGCSNNYFFSIQNCGNRGAKNFNARIYADINQDGDFDDAGELLYDLTNTIVNGNCAFYNPSFFMTIPTTTNSGNIRFRYALREGAGTATACGGYLGEIEDYTLVVSNNTAPVLNNSGTPVLNALTETQTDNTGISINRFIQTTQPAVTLITESDPCSTQRGIALIGTSGPGNWQYQVYGGSWTDMGAISSANALLLGQADRIRFIPSGPGSAGITFRAWDRTIGTTGQFYNITSTGGTTAFSSASETSGLTVYSAASSSGDIKMYSPTIGADLSDYNITAASFNPSTGIIKHSDLITTDYASGFGYDMVLDAVNNKLYWTGGGDGTSLMRSNLDGSDIEVVIGGYFGYAAGLAISEDKLFVTDWGTAIYSVDLNDPFNLGNVVRITGGAGQIASGEEYFDIEYYNGKIYYWGQLAGGGYQINQANPDGTGTVVLYSQPVVGAANGLDVVNGNLYWTETTSSATYLRTKPISGGTVTTLATATDRNFLDLMVNTSTNKIYFTDVASATGNDPYINSIPLAGGAVTKELVLENTLPTVVFARNMGTLPVHFINIKAWLQNNNNIVEWNIAEESNVKLYIIERSSDGRNFIQAGSIEAVHNSRYQWTDAQPLPGNNYYRIRSLDNDGKQNYSAIVLVTHDEKNKTITVLPTVITDGQFVVRLQNNAPGSYQLKMINSSGQQVYNQQLSHSGGSSAQTINVPSGLGKGIYRVIITGSNTAYSVSILLN